MPSATLTKSDLYMVKVNAPVATQEWVDGRRAALATAVQALADRRAWLVAIKLAGTNFYSDKNEVAAVAFAERQLAMAELSLAARREAEAAAALAHRVAA